MDILLNSIKNVSIIVLTAYPLTWNGAMQRALSMIPSSRDKIILALVFGLLSIFGNLTTTEVFNRATLNSGLVGPVVGGIIAGPAVGFFAGVAGGLHRLSMNSFTMVPDCLATVAGGLLGGLLFWRFNDRRMSFVPSFLVGIAAGVINYVLILALAKPYILAVTFVEWTGLRSILAVGTGTGIFISIVNSVRSRVYSIGTSYAEKATEIAQKALPVIKGTLAAGVAEKLVRIIQESAIADAVAITDGQSILAFAGEGSASHLVGGRDLALTGRFATGGEEIVVANSRREVGCTIPDCPHDAVIIAPLFRINEQVWFLHLYKVRDAVHPPDVKLVTGIASLLGLHFQSRRLEIQAQLLAKAEYAALRSQVNPHFLFNTLSAIKLHIRQDPAQAQQLLLALASFFRRTLEMKDEFIPLSEEVESVELYLTIQRARFGDRLCVGYDIPPECLSFPIPAFVVQPLVENCFNHGFSDSGEGMRINIRSRYDDGVFRIAVEDNGKGIPPDVIEAVKADKVISRMGVGLTNVHRRLKSIYGRNCTFMLENRNPGAAVEIIIRTEDR